MPKTAKPEDDVAISRIAIDAYADLAKDLAGGGRVYETAILRGQAFGFLISGGGILLALLGASGTIDLMLQATTLQARLTNASPGVVIALMGMIVIWRYKPNMTHDVRLRPGELDLRGMFVENKGDLLRDGDRNEPHFRSSGSH